MQSVDARIEFCDRYFTAVEAKMRYAANGYREYELPRDIDKELTDRPYYWMWVEQTGQDVPPTVVRLAFDDEAQARESTRVREQALAAASPYLTDIQRQYFVAPKVELVTLGSFRLDKLYKSSMERGRFASIAPSTAVAPRGLVPWLMFNLLVSYRCDITEQTLMSIGICLENGQIVENFYSLIENIEMSVLNPHHIRNRMQMSVDDGFRRLREYIERKIAKSDHQWAEEAEERLSREIEQIETYYDSIRHEKTETDQKVLQAECRRKIELAIARGAAKVELDVTQVALVGLVDKGDLSRTHTSRSSPM